MSQSTHPTPTQYGRIHPPDEAWLAQAAARADPRAGPADHRHAPSPVGPAGPSLPAATSCSPTCAPATTWWPPCFWSATRCIAPRGPCEMRPVGETEFVAGIAAMSDSGQYGPTRVAAGIVGFADLTLGDRVEPVLQAHIRAGGGRFRGVRHSAAWDASPIIGTFGIATGPHGLQRQGLPRRARAAHRARAVARRLGLSSAAGRRGRSGAQRPRRQHHRGPRRRAARLRAVRRQARRGLRRLEGRDPRAGDVPERDDEARRHDDAPGRLRLRRGARADRPRRSWPRSGGRTSSRASSASAPTAACSRATSRWTRWASATAPLWNALKRIAAGASADEKLALFSGTARRAYRLQ